MACPTQDTKVIQEKLSWQNMLSKLCNPMHNSGINITTDNWFTSTKLAEDLLLKQITLLGTLKKKQTRYSQTDCYRKKSRGGVKFVWV